LFSEYNLQSSVAFLSALKSVFPIEGIDTSFSSFFNCSLSKITENFFLKSSAISGETESFAPDLQAAR
jgi:hypothetical protein